MDTYMAGIVRWINAAGIETTLSCDGHGYIKPQLKPRNESQAAALNYFLNLVSNGDWRFHVHQFRFLQGDERIDARDRRDWRRLRQSTPPDYDRAWLLDVGEKIHRHRDSLRQLVEIADELSRDNTTFKEFDSLNRLRGLTNEYKDQDCLAAFYRIRFFCDFEALFCHPTT